jgi:hypothetical protein
MGRQINREPFDKIRSSIEEKELSMSQPVVQCFRVAETAFSMILLLALAGCGGTAQINNPSHSTMKAGNWSITAKSSAETYIVGGNIQQSNSSLVGQMRVLGPCESPTSNFDPSVAAPLSGAVDGTTFTLKVGPTPSGTVIRMKLSGSGTSLNNMAGTFTLEKEGCGPDQGTVEANIVSVPKGHYLGKGIGTSGDSNVSVDLDWPQQAGPADASGYIPLNVNLSYKNSSCSANTPVNGYLAGSIVDIVFVEGDGPNPVIFAFSGLLDPQANTVLKGTYQTLSGGSQPACSGDQGTIELDSTADL